MSWVRAVTVVFLCMIVPSSGWGADMKLGLGGAVEYDDNIYRTNYNKEDDLVFRIIPQVRFIEDEGKFQWDLNYRAPWEKGLEADRVDGFSHLVNAGASYFLDGQTQFFFSDRFTHSDAISRFQTVGEPGVAPSLSTFREPVNRNDATLGMQHTFNPRLQGNLAFSNRLFESDLPRRSDNMVYVGNANLVYALSPRHQLGGGAAGTVQHFSVSNDGSLPSGETFFLNLYGTWTWKLDETTTFSVTGGPTFVDDSQDEPPTQVERAVVPYAVTTQGVAGFLLSSCGLVNGQPVLERCTQLAAAADAAEEAAILGSGFHPVSYLAGQQPPSRSDSTWTFFGELALDKRWSPRLLSTLTYRRTESTASGVGSATLDLVSFITTWRISELWDVALRGDFTRRESTAPSTQTFTVVQGATTPGVNSAFAETINLTATVVDRSLDTNRWGVSAQMSRRLTKHIYARLRYSFNEQTSKSNTIGRTSDFRNNLVTLGVQYDFDRWHLW